MGFIVVNTIHRPGIDFGNHLVESLGARVIAAMGRTEEELIASAADADAVVCSGPVQPWTERVIRHLTRCRIIASLGIGVDRIDLDAATRRDIVVTNVPDYCIDEVATHALALMLALNRRLFDLDAAVRRAAVNFVPPNRSGLAQLDRPMRRLHDQVLGIVGLGRIGTAAAMKARGLGMRVIAHDPFVWDAVMRAHGVVPVDVETLLATADVVSIHCSLTAATRNMIDARALDKMKPTAVLINTARGEVVDEAALVRALSEGRIAGAGLDVTVNDPLPDDDPLRKTPNTILTGHAAWYSAQSDSAAEFWQQAMAQVALALQGRWPAYPVNPAVKASWMAAWGRRPLRTDGEADDPRL